MTRETANLKKWITFLLCFYSFLSSHAQSLYHYDNLSNLAYTRQKDSIAKNWNCPSVFTSKNTQKKYQELWESRTNFVTSAITNQQYVKEPEIVAYLQQLVAELVKANPGLIKTAPLVLIDRNAAVNAYTVGRNLLAVNLGLISFVQSREELALVIAHELSHNILDHPDRSMRERAEWLTSAEYEQALKDVSNAKYERFSKLKKVFEGYELSSSRHQRYHESDADSLAILLLKKSNIGFDARFFLRLDSADLQYRIPLAEPLADYYKNYGLAFENSWTTKRSRGLSTHAYNFQETKAIEDSLKTHPDCVQRYEATIKYNTGNLHLTPLPAGLQAKATKMLIWRLFDNMALTTAFYRILREKDKGNTDPWYDFMLSSVIGGLAHAENTLRRFNAIGIVPKEHVCKNYYELQTALEQMPGETLRSHFRNLKEKSFWQQLPPDAIALRDFFAELLAANDASVSSKRLAQNYLAAHSNSMYCEFINHFTK